MSQLALTAPGFCRAQGCGCRLSVADTGGLCVACVEFEQVSLRQRKVAPCAACHRQPRACGSYCHPCEAARRRRLLLKNADKPCADCHSRPRGSYSTYCRPCQNARLIAFRQRQAAAGAQR